MLSLSTGVTVFADKNTNNIEASGISPYMDYFDLDDNECDVRWFDFNKLTDDEQKELDRIYERYEEIEAAIYGEDFEATDDEIINNYSRYEKELLELEEKASVLEEKAEDYGALTEDEIRELKNIYEQFDVIGEKILGDDDNLTDE